MYIFVVRSVFHFSEHERYMMSDGAGPTTYSLSFIGIFEEKTETYTLDPEAPLLGVL